MVFTSPPAPVQRLHHPLLAARGVTLDVKREDLLHPTLSGNKWHKLRYNLAQARAQGYNRVLSFGGAYSNHLHALAFAGRETGLRTLGLVRGELCYPLNPTLQDALDWGMQLEPIARADYRRRHDPEFIRQLTRQHGPCWIIPEGGANADGVKGCMEWVEAMLSGAIYDYLCLPCGSGTTLAGAIAGARGRAQVLGFSVVKGDLELEARLEQMLAWVSSERLDGWRVVRGYEAGGFAKLDAQLAAFLHDWQHRNSLPLEPLYSGKLFYGLFSLIKQGYFAPGSRILALHTGGLQGLRGLKHRRPQA